MPDNPPYISQHSALYCESPSEARCSYAKILAQQLKIPLVAQDVTQQFPYLLVVTEHHLELRQTHTRAKPVYVDFLSASNQYRRLKANKKNELIAKAIGIKNKEKFSVIDTTAGLGADGFILACLGCTIHWLERSTIVAALLQDGINRFLSDTVSGMRETHTRKCEKLDLSLTIIDAMVYLEKLPVAEYPDVIYLDPMFPTRHKSALVKKEMRILRDLAGDDLDAPALLALALCRAKKRVVVKRPRLATAIEGKTPDLVYQGQSSRFDVYFTPVC